MKIIIYYLFIILFFSLVIVQVFCLLSVVICWDVLEIIFEVIIINEFGGKLDVCNINKNGSYDYGLMQINIINIDLLKF